MVKVKLLGYGDVTFPDKESLWPCIMIKGKEANVLLDISPAYIRASEKELKKVKLILVSHPHADHILGFPLFAAFAATRGNFREEEIKIVAGELTSQTMRKILKLTYREFFNYFMFSYFIES